MGLIGEGGEESWGILGTGELVFRPPAELGGRAGSDAAERTNVTEVSCGGRGESTLNLTDMSHSRGKVYHENISECLSTQSNADTVFI